MAEYAKYIIKPGVLEVSPTQKLEHPLVLQQAVEVGIPTHYKLLKSLEVDVTSQNGVVVMKYSQPRHDYEPEDYEPEPIVATGKTAEEAEKAMRSSIALALIKHALFSNISPHADKIVPARSELSDIVRQL